MNNQSQEVNETVLESIVGAKIIETTMQNCIRIFDLKQTKTGKLLRNRQNFMQKRIIKLCKFMPFSEGQS